MILINLNGPAGCGKDALAEELQCVINQPRYLAMHMEFKELLFDVAIRNSGLSRKLWFALYEREYKERPCPYLQVNGVSVSPRDWMIHCSENVMKPTFGDDVFGKAFATKLKDLKKSFEGDSTKLVIIVSDGGFIEESVPVVEEIGQDNYMLTRIHRIRKDGTAYNFDGDSRRYIYSAEFPVGAQMPETDIMNEEGDLRGTALKICKFVEDMTGEKLHG